VIREAIRAIQDARKSSGFDISDRIHVRWNCAPEFVAALNSGSQWISEEVLAVSFTQEPSLGVSEEELGLKLSLQKA
jgi:isoleucyl-tRNA synthetase